MKTAQPSADGAGHWAPVVHGVQPPPVVQLPVLVLVVVLTLVLVLVVTVVVVVDALPPVAESP